MTTITPEIIAQMQLVAEFVKSKGSKFIGLTYTNENRETARNLVHFGVNYINVLKRDLAVLENMKIDPKDEVMTLAHSEVLESVKKSIAGTQDAYTKENYYTYVAPGVKYGADKKTGNITMYFNAFSVNKTVLIPGEYPVVKSSDKTIAKKKLSKSLKKSKFREYKLDLELIQNLKMNGNEMVFTK